MKLTLKHGKRSFEYEHQPMPPERFTALCKLAGAMIGGLVLVALVHKGSGDSQPPCPENPGAWVNDLHRQMRPESAALEPTQL